MPNKSLNSSTIEEDYSPIASVADLGLLLRAQRKAQKLTLHDAAALSGVSIQFLHDLETGKQSIQMGRALKYALMLGIKLSAWQTS